MAQLVGKIAIVTGASRGIGRAIVASFVREGASVVAVARDPEGLAGTAAAAEEGAGQLETLVGDVACAADVEAAVTFACERFGGLTTLVNIAATLAPGTVVDTSLEDFDRTMAVNVRGVFLGCKLGLPAIIEGGGGSIVNMGSVNSLVAEKNLVAYSASKGAVLMLSKAVALDFADRGVRCNAICPGFVDTPMNVPHYESLGGREVLERGLADFQPIGRPILDSEIADAAVFLASDRSKAITGTAFMVDGGATAGA